MEEQNESIQSLLENDNLREQISSFIQEEVVLPESSTCDSEIKIKRINDKEENEILLHGQQDSENFKTLADKLKEKEKIENAKKSPYANVCGFNINVKKLLENPDIRRQIAPFIEKQVLIPVRPNRPDYKDIFKNSITNSSTEDDLLKSKSSQLQSSLIHENVQSSLPYLLEDKNNIIEQKTYIKEEINLVDSTELIPGNDACKETIVDINNIITEIEKKIVASTSNFQNKSDSIRVNVKNLQVEKCMKQNCIQPNQQLLIQNGSKIALNIPHLQKFGKINFLKGFKIKINKKKILPFSVKRKIVKYVHKEKTSNKSNPFNKKPQSTDCILPNINTQAMPNEGLENSIHGHEQTSIIKEEFILPDDNLSEMKASLPETELKTLIETKITESSEKNTLEANLHSNKNQDFIVHEADLIDNNMTVVEQQEVKDAINNDKDQILKINKISNCRKIFSIKRRIGERSSKSLKSCPKCGKKYLRFKMLRKHEMSCMVEKKDYKCVMCSYSTKEEQIFKHHVQSHIVEIDFNEIESNQSIPENSCSKKYKEVVHFPQYITDHYEEDKNKNDNMDKCKDMNESEINIKIESDDQDKDQDCSLSKDCNHENKNDHSRCDDVIEDEIKIELPSRDINEEKKLHCTCRKSVGLNYQCAVCGGNSSNLNTHVGLEDQALLNHPICVKQDCINDDKIDCFSNTTSKNSKKSCKEQSNLSCLSNKIPHVCLVRLELALPNFTSGSSITIKSEPDEELESKAEIDCSKDMKFANSQDTGEDVSLDEMEIKSESLIEDQFSVESIEKFEGIKGKRKMESPLTENSQVAKKRNLQTCKWVQLFCSKCNKMESNSDDVEIAREKKICTRCKAILRYKCVICDGKFDTFYTISYHLRYCSTQSKPSQRKRSPKKSLKCKLNNTRIQKRSNENIKQIDQQLICFNCGKKFDDKHHYHRHTSRCGKTKKRKSCIQIEAKVPKLVSKKFAPKNNDEKQIVSNTERKISTDQIDQALAEILELSLEPQIPSS